jgi:hypothetical protein
MRRVVFWFVLFVAFVIPRGAAFASDVLKPNQTLFLFGGVFRSGTFPGWTMIPFDGRVERNYLAGGAVDTKFFSSNGFDFGVEVGLAGRFGDSTSAEVFGGPSVHYRYITIGTVRVSPGFVAGLSAVSNTIGIERQRELDNSGNATLLFYLGPELAFQFEQLPDVEFVVRTHHRSGAEGTLGRMREGHNANLFGARFHF